MERQVSWTLWALPLVLLLLRPDSCAAATHSGTMLRAAAATNKPHGDYDLNLDDVYASPAAMAKYMNSYSFPGPVDYLSAAAASSDGAPFEFYPTLSTGSVFDNFAFSPTIKLDELAYHEPAEPSAKHSNRNKEKAWRLKEGDEEYREGTRDSSKSDVKGDGWSRPEAKRNSEEPHSVEEEATTVGRRRRPHGSSGSYFRGVPERDDSSEEDERDTPREEDDDRAATLKTTSLSDRDEIAYSRGNNRRPFIRVKNSGAVVSDEASSEERRKGAEASREFETRPKNGGNGGNGDNGRNGVNGDRFGSTRNERLENGRRRNVGGYQTSSELPSVAAEPTGSRSQVTSRGRGDDTGIRDVRYNSYNGNDLDVDLRAVNGAGLRETFTPTLTTTQRPEVSSPLLQRPDISALLRQQSDIGALLRQRPEVSALLKPTQDTSLSGTRTSNSKRRPGPAYTPDTTMYQSEQDDEGSSSRDQEETTTNGYSSTSSTAEPLRFSSEEETTREENSDSAEGKIRALMRPTQTVTRMNRPTSAELGAAATSSTNGLGSRRIPSTTNGQRSSSTTTTATTNSRKRGGVGGYGAPEPPPPLPPASSLVLLGRDPTPSLDQNSAATATTSVDQRAAATNGNGGRPRTLFHQQGFQGPYSYRFGFDTADPYNPQTRYEEKDAEGRVRGSYSYMDPKGRLQVVRYEADRQGGFRVKGSFGQYPDGKP